MLKKLLSISFLLSMFTLPAFAQVKVASCAGKDIKSSIAFFDADQKEFPKARKITFRNHVFFVAPKSFMTAKDFVKVEMATDLKSTNTTPPNVTLTKEGIKKLQTATGKLAKTSGWIAIMDKDLPVTFIPVQAEIATPYIVLGRVAMEQVCVKTH